MALTPDQLKFLAKRLLAKTDADAAELCRLAVGTVYNWKCNDPEFKERYEGIFNDGIILARDILRQHLGDAALVLVDGMQATERGKPDHQTRINAAKTMLAGLGVLTEKRQVGGDPDNPVQVSVNADQLLDAVERRLRDARNDSPKQ